MDRFRNYRIDSARLSGWDYRSAGRYFITVCTRRQECLRRLRFGRIVDGEMRLSKAGRIAAEELRQTEEVRANVDLDRWTIMPNHLHAIVVIEETANRAVSMGPGAKAPSTSQAGSLGAIIGQFKSVCTKRIRMEGFHGFTWQPRFYDRIIRDERELDNIRQYISDNPAKWSLDRENPANQPPHPS